MKLNLIFLLCLSANIATAQTDSVLLKQHLTTITKTNGFRSYENLSLLNKTADYIFKELEKYADTVFYQTYTVEGKLYKNVVADFGIKNPKTIVIGAHYDVCGDQEGADDNASGVAGLLELARQMKGQNLKNKVELVAYTLEEPPYFRTENMGSYVHAKSLLERKTDVYGMISLEMIGFFKTQKHTQSYPIGLMSWVYGNKGDYITLVNKLGSTRFTRRFTRAFQRSKTIKTKEFYAPKALTGVDFSDHLNYWKFGFAALMITDTSFYRNKNYHEPTDTLETLDFSRMAKVVDGVFKSILNL
jgi:Zn-dependent M28 family amino/carboxypeptidase